MTRVAKLVLFESLFPPGEGWADRWDVEVWKVESKETLLARFLEIIPAYEEEHTIRRQNQIGKREKRLSLPFGIGLFLELIDQTFVSKPFNPEETIKWFSNRCNYILKRLKKGGIWREEPIGDPSEIIEKVIFVRDSLQHSLT